MGDGGGEGEGEDLSGTSGYSILVFKAKIKTGENITVFFVGVCWRLDMTDEDEA